MVGKSCLIYRFINYNIPKSHDPTVEDRFISIIKIHENKYNIEILDTGGDEEYQNSLDFWISFGEGFLLVFAINDEKSFNTLKYKRDKIILFKNV
jgi:small GTP-binding protein